MAPTHGARVVTLGWQTWSIVVVVLLLVLAVGAFVLNF
jgi:hypothetical protein